MIREARTATRKPGVTAVPLGYNAVTRVHVSKAVKTAAAPAGGATP